MYLLGTKGAKQLENTGVGTELFTCYDLPVLVLALPDLTSFLFVLDSGVEMPPTYSSK